MHGAEGIEPRLNSLRLFSPKNLTPMKQIKRFHWASGVNMEHRAEGGEQKADDPG